MNSGKHGCVSTIFWIAAFCFACLWIICLLDEIQTTEAWLGSGAGSLIPNYLLVLQPFQLAGFFGVIPADQLGPVLIAWIVESFVLVCVLAFEFVIVYIKKFNTRLSKVFTSLCFAALGVDAYSNYVSHFTGGTIWHQLVFVVGLAAGAAFLPVIVLACIKVAQAEA